MAEPFPGTPVGRPGGRSTSRTGAINHRGAGGKDRGRHPGIHPEERDPLVSPVHGGEIRAFRINNRTDLARFRAQTAPHRRVQTVQRPNDRGEGLRRRRAPTILSLLGLNPDYLQAVQIEHTATLPAVSYTHLTLPTKRIV